MVEHWSVGSITRALLPILLVLTALELVGGLTLGSFEATLVQYPTLLVLVPAVIGTAGNLGSILSARLSTAFHFGTLSFERTDEQLLGNAITTVLLAGTILGEMDAELRRVQGLLVMVPAFLAVRGSVYGSLGSRLSSALHQGLIDRCSNRTTAS